MPVDYQGGKIYTIRAPATDKYYIGSTADSLPKRFYEHKASFARYQNGKMNNITSFQIVELEGAYIELLETYPCNSKAELERREGELIREHRDNCVNRNIAGRTQKEYREANKDKVRILVKNWQEANKEKQKAKVREKITCECGASVRKYHLKYHRETARHATRLFNIQNTNKDILNAKQSEKIICECGASMRRDNLTNHRKTARHATRLYNIQNAEEIEKQKVEQEEKANELKKQKADDLEKLLLDTIPAEKLPAIMQMINAV